MAAVFLSYVIMFGLAVSTVGGLEIGDYGFHMQIIHRYLDEGVQPLLDGNNGNGFPYPPYSHVLTAFLSIVSGFSPEQVLAAAQVFVFPLVLYSFFYFVLYHRGLDTATSALFIGLLGFALWDRPSQVIPHAIDSMLLPVLMIAYLTGRNRLFIITALSLVYNHAFYMLPLLFVLAGESWLHHRPLGRFAWIGLGCLPLFYLLAPFWQRILLFPDLNEAASPQFVRLRANPLWGIMYLGPFPLLLGLTSLYNIIRNSGRGHIDAYSWALAAWIVGFMPLLFSFPHRALTYLAMPLAALAADHYHSESQRVLFFAVWLLYLAVEFAMLYAGWRIPPVNGLFNLLIGWTEVPF